MSESEVETLVAHCKALEKRVVALEGLTAKLTAAWNGLELELGPVQLLHDYEVLDHNFDHTVGPNDVMAGWGYGILHNDVKTFRRRVVLKKTPV